jgi:hypothetical protein
MQTAFRKAENIIDENTYNILFEGLCIVLYFSTVKKKDSRHFRNKGKEYLQSKIEELETNSKIKNIGNLFRDINDFKKGYQPRTNIVKEEKGDLVADSYSILARWRKHFSQLFNEHRVNNVRKTEIHTTELLVPERSVCEVKLVTEKLKGHKSLSVDIIPAELIKAGCTTICYEFRKLIISIVNKEKVPEEGNESIILPIYKKGEKTDCSNYRGISLLSTKYKIISKILLPRLTPHAEEIIGDHQCGFRHKTKTTDHIFCIRQIFEKKWEYN